MIVWIDAQLSPSLAQWITERFGIEAVAVQQLGLRDAKDRAIFEAARVADATVITKDNDFVLLQDRFGAPPKIVWVRCGNTSNVRLRSVLESVLRDAFELLAAGERLVEITDPSSSAT